MSPKPAAREAVADVPVDGLAIKEAVFFGELSVAQASKLAAALMVLYALEAGIVARQGRQGAAAGMRRGHPDTQGDLTDQDTPEVACDSSDSRVPRPRVC